MFDCGDGRDDARKPLFFNLVLTKGLSSSLLRIICRSLKRALQSTPTPALWRSTSLLLMSFDRSLAWEKLFLWTSVFFMRGSDGHRANQWDTGDQVLFVLFVLLFWIFG